MSDFEDRLFTDLMREHGDGLATVDRPAATRRGPARRVLVATGAAGLAGAVVLGANTFGAGTPAYAVTRGVDGTVTVSLRDIDGVDGANEKLRELGVRAAAVPATRDCDAVVVPYEPLRSAIQLSAGADDGDSGSVSFPADSIPAGGTLVLAAQVAGNQVRMSVTVVEGAAPKCVPDLPGPSGEFQGPSDTGGAGPVGKVSPAR